MCVICQPANPTFHLSAIFSPEYLLLFVFVSKIATDKVIVCVVCQAANPSLYLSAGRFACICVCIWYSNWIGNCECDMPGFQSFQLPASCYIFPKIFACFCVCIWDVSVCVICRTSTSKLVIFILKFSLEFVCVFATATFTISDKMKFCV